MSTDRDDAAERQARVDRMINEFREAQARRSGKPNDKVVESNADAKAPAPDQQAHSHGASSATL